MPSASPACGGDDGGDGDGGGGSSETVSASAYAADVCNAMQDWMQGIQDRTAALTENLQPGEEQGKDLLVDLMSEMSSQTGELVDAIEDAGVPDVEGGEESADQLVAGLRETQEAFDKAKEDIEALPDDPQSLQQGAAQIGATLQEALTNVGSSLEDSASKELTEVFEKEKSCSEIA